MAEREFFHKHVHVAGPGGVLTLFTMQVIYDGEREPKAAGLFFCGRVIDVHGKTVFQSPWATGNMPAVRDAEAWCASSAAREHQPVDPTKTEITDAVSPGMRTKVPAMRSHDDED